MPSFIEGSLGDFQLSLSTNPQQTPAPEESQHGWAFVFGQRVLFCSPEWLGIHFAAQARKSDMGDGGSGMGEAVRPRPALRIGYFRGQETVTEE